MSGDLAKAKRRHKALIRERIALAAQGKVDEQLNAEVEKIEALFPHLALNDGSASVQAPEVRPPTVDLNIKVPASPALADGPPVPREAKKPKRKTNHNTELRTADGLDACSLFSLQLYNESHQRSLVGVTDFMKIALIGVFNAVFHNYVEPCSSLGYSVNPFLFCFMLHLGNLYYVFVKRRRRFSLAMLCVYAVFDFLPSLCVCAVAYGSVISIAGLFRQKQISYQCESQ